MRLFGFILILLAISGGCQICAQEFIFPMRFEDSRGNIDTLFFGYDVDATDSVDLSFGEVNIIERELDSLFDVRISDEISARNWRYDSTGNYHLKKQILKKNCSNWPTAFSIDIKCKYWPVTASWDNSKFNDSCRQRSVFTSVTPGGWWDVGSASNLYRVVLSEKSNVTFSPNWKDYIPFHSAYLTDDSDTISVFWLAITNHDHLWVSVSDEITNTSFELYPNPAEAIFQIRNVDSGVIQNIEVMDLMGNIRLKDNRTNSMNVEGLESGIYFVRIKISDDEMVIRRLLKY